MISPKVSVIIPTYNHADYLPAAMQSVLEQTYRDFELIIVNDGSTDHTSDVVQQFHDPRINYVVQANQGATAARNTGIRLATGELIALLDADDLFHPEKLQRHIEFLAHHPEIGATYNARFELHHSAETIRELWRPPATVTLAELVMGFPFSPSDMVLRREWAFRVNLFDERYVFYGDDLDFFCRLALAGCKFARVDRALNYRRHQTGRVVKKLAACVDFALRPLATVFADPRCPTEVLALQNSAVAAHCLSWATLAFTQQESALGQQLLRETVRLNPALLAGEPCELVKEWMYQSILDEHVSHVERLHQIFDQLPPELTHLQRDVDWAVAQGYLERGARAILWNQLEVGKAHFKRASELNAKLDKAFLDKLAYQLFNYETEFGDEAAQQALRRLTPCIQAFGNRIAGKRLNGYFSINQAFKFYRLGLHTKTLRYALQALFYDPTYVQNRGVIAVLFRSLLGALHVKFSYSASNKTI